MTATLATRVAQRFVARDFPTEKALEKYIHEHPQADKAKHQVVEQEDHGKDEGHGEDSHGDHGDHGDHGGGMFSRLKGALKAVASKLKDAPKDAQKFVGDAEHRKAALTKGVEAMKKAPAKYVRQLAKVAKHEVHEFKTAGKGLKAVMGRGKPTPEQKKAIKTVGIHMGISIAAAVLTTASPALAALAVGKAMGKHMALKAVTAAMGDLHVLEEWGHIGHGIKHVVESLKFAEEDDGAKPSPEELFAALIMQHIGEQMKDIDDDTLAEAMGGGDEDEEAEDGQQKQAAHRVAARYLMKIARPMMTPWEGSDHAWPVVPPAWDEEPLRSDRFGDVFVMRYVDFGLAGSPMVTVDTTPWTHHNRPEFTYSIQVFDEKAKSGKIPVEGYERTIPQLLDEALAIAKREVAGFAKQLDQFKMPHWKIDYDKSGDDLVVEYEAPGLSEYSDSSMSGSFYSPLAIFNGGKSDYDISYSKGTDYEGHFGVRRLSGDVRSIEDMKTVLRDAEQLWKRAEAKDN